MIKDKKIIKTIFRNYKSILNWFIFKVIFRKKKSMCSICLKTNDTRNMIFVFDPNFVSLLDVVAHRKCLKERTSNRYYKRQNRRTVLFSFYTKKQMYKEKRNKHCYICNKKINHLKDANLDHVIPKSKGGSNKPKNLRLTHIECNYEKADNIL